MIIMSGVCTNSQMHDCGDSLLTIISTLIPASDDASFRYDSKMFQNSFLFSSMAYDLYVKMYIHTQLWLCNEVLGCLSEMVYSIHTRVSNLQKKSHSCTRLVNST